MNRLAQIDFFQPLCELFEGKLQLHPEGLELTNYSTVPSLCELCLRKIRTTSKICEPILYHPLSLFLTFLHSKIYSLHSCSTELYFICIIIHNI